jgi:deoxycytidine triphosphate deaminase
LIKSDRWIKQMALEKGMIKPFEDRQVRQGTISYGLSSYGYDIRIADEFKLFTNINTTIVDPKSFDPRSFVDYQGPVAIVPPNSFALGRSVEYFKIPRNVLTICVGKCVSADTYVVEGSTGRFAPITEFLSRGGSAASVRGQTVTAAEVTEGSMQGALPVYDLRTRTGRRLKATRNHPLLTFNGWRPLGDLRVGDRIAVPRRFPIFGRRAMRDCEVALLGLLISDGQCATPGSSPRYTSGDPVLRDYFAQAVAAFGGVPRPVGRMSVNATNRGGRGGAMETNRVYAWLAGLGLAVTSPQKFVAAPIFELPASQLGLFLRALFSGDGGIAVTSDGIQLEFSTTSERLARDVQHLLLRFEIVAMLRERDTESGRDAWALTVTSREGILRFARSIGFIPGCEKQRKLDDACTLIADRPQQKSNFDTLPPEAWRVFSDRCHGQGTSLRKMGVERTRPAQSMPRAVARDLAWRLGDEMLGALATGDVLWDTIQEKPLAGVEPVYDLTLPQTANFVGNDIVVHNSTYARCGIITNVTPFEPEWEGFVTLEISNTTPLPARIYANEGIAQVLFFESDEACQTSYADRQGKYQGQQGIVLPTV